MDNKFKVMFVGEKRIHSNKKNQDYHVIEVVLPPRKRSDTASLSRRSPRSISSM